MGSRTRQSESYRRARLARERGMVLKKSSPTRVCLIFPNTYYVGMSNLAVHILYSILNARNDCVCERSFCEKPLTGLSLETGSPLQDFHIIAFSVSFEPDYMNILSTLIAAKIPPLASDRTDSHPIVVAGGPCIFSNPEPLAECIDLFIIGEGEEAVNEIVDEFVRARNRRYDRTSTLRAFSEIPGTYVPSLYEPVYADDGCLAGMENRGGASLPISARVVSNLDEFPCASAIVTPDTEFAGMVLVELGRGCRRGCKFCSACHTYLPRFRSLPVLKEQILAARHLSTTIGLVTAELADYPQRRKLVDFLVKNDFGFSASSVRADAITEDMIAGLRAAGQRTLTLAPEVATEKLAAFTGKRIAADTLLRAVYLALENHIWNFRLYFMIGFPTEDDADVKAIGELVSRVHMAMRTAAATTRRMGKLTLSVNPFVPKPFTPLESAAFASPRTLSRRMRILRQAIAAIPNTRLKTESPRMAELQCVLARGDRRTLRLVTAIASGESVAHAMRKFDKLSSKFTGALPTNAMHPWNTIRPPINVAGRREVN